jgi:D-3-phosphoglycerate dehydrogenase / 2-oxoglutarate reductase
LNGKILVTARSFRKTEGPHKQVLRDAGYTLAESPNDQPMSGAELAPWLADVDGAILGLDVVDAQALEGVSRLRVISRYGVGFDSVDLAAATRHGVVVTITPGANAVSVAELAVALLFALARSIPYHDRVAKQGKWSRLQGIELTGATMGLVGLGRIGREVAQRCRGLGMQVVGYDPLLTPDQIAALGVTPSGFEELLARSDVVSLHLPLTPQTRDLIGSAALAQMKPSAFLINTARGGLVDENALYEALKNKRLAGAAADVFAQEPPDCTGLVSLDNFIAAPHIGSATGQTTLRMGLMAAQNALAVLAGERPEGVVNPEVYTNR